MVAMKQNPSVVGRFAPSPTGPLHFGSLVAALGSYLMARRQGGRWLLRIEDLDAPRVTLGAADQQMFCLDHLGFEWDGEVLFQSQRSERYRQVLDQLIAEGLVFPCSCSRRDIIASAPHVGEEGPIYPGTCRQRVAGTRVERSYRLRVDQQPITFHDGVFGVQTQNLAESVGDFVLYRADGVFAYQLAVVVDDMDSGVTQVVRGADLLASTPRQIFLYRCLNELFPEYHHLPLALGNDAEKLSKRHGQAGIINAENAPLALWHALAFLGQQPPEDLLGAPPVEQLRWGIEAFKPERISVKPTLAPPLGVFSPRAEPVASQFCRRSDFSS